MKNGVASPCYCPKSLVAPMTIGKKNQDTSVAVLHARKPSCRHHRGLISHTTHFFAKASFLVLFQITAPYIRGGELGK